MLSDKVVCQYADPGSSKALELVSMSIGLSSAR
jgi:hypothetical protein